MISQKSKDDAKAVFERNSSAGQMNFRRSSSTTQPPPPQVSLVPEEEEVPVKPRSPSPPPPPIVAKASSPEPPPPAPTTAANANGTLGGGGGDDEVVPPPPIFGNDEVQRQPDVTSSSQLQPGKTEYKETGLEPFEKLRESASFVLRGAGKREACGFTQPFKRFLSLLFTLYLTFHCRDSFSKLSCLQT